MRPSRALSEDQQGVVHNIERQLLILSNNSQSVATYRCSTEISVSELQAEERAMYSTPVKGCLLKKALGTYAQAIHYDYAIVVVALYPGTPRLIRTGFHQQTDVLWVRTHSLLIEI